MEAASVMTMQKVQRFRVIAETCLYPTVSFYSSKEKGDVHR